jgi:anaerobic selenocysteine-containing dehydrogenase
MQKVATCPLCEAACGVVVEVSDGRIHSIRGNDDDVLSRGYICPKAAALTDLHYDPDRLRAPVIREGSGWREASWDEALDQAADGLIQARRRHGRDAVGIYYGNPVAHNLGLMTHALPFARALRTRNVYSASSADQLPQMLAAFRMFGHFALMPVPDLDRTDFLLIFGANPVVSNGSLMTAPNMRKRLDALRARGGRVVVFDPRRSETAVASDVHVACRPGSDALLLAALLHVVFERKWDRLGRLAAQVKRVDELAAFVGTVSPERVADRTGVSAETIRRIAADFARATRAACYGRVGICTQQHGTLAAWLVQALNLVTGRIDDVGGMMLPTPAVDSVRILTRLGLRGTYDRWRSRVRHLPEFCGELPVATLADEVEADDGDHIRALITIAGNPVLSAPSGRRLDRAFGRLDHVVSIDPYLNETTRHADVILPPAPPLSRAHYDLALSAFFVRNVAKYSEPVVPRAPSERHDWEIVAALAGRVLAPRPFRRMAVRGMSALRPERLLAPLLRFGPYRLGLRKLRESPNGVDLGPLEAGRIARLVATDDGQIDAAPEDFLRAARAHLFSQADRGDTEELLLIGRRQLRGNNSWMHNLPRLMKGPDRCTLLMHPTDATSRNLATGDMVQLGAEAGTVTVPVEVTDEVRCGVVSLPHGWGHDRDGIRLQVAQEHAGVSINDVTSDRHLDTLSGTAAFNGLPVSVRRVTDPEIVQRRE